MKLVGGTGWRGGCRVAVCSPIAVAAGARHSGAAIQGRVTDESGAVVPAAVVTVTRADRFTRSLFADEYGAYEMEGLTPGRYAVHVDKPGFESFERQPVEVNTAEAVTLNLRLNLEVTQQRNAVQAEAETLSTDPAANASALVLNNRDLEALSDDPEDLLADLKALARPASGLNGGQSCVDGFSSGRFPPKESVREVHINQNPIAAEYDLMGLGHIEVFRKPGSDKFHGMIALKYGNAVLRSRNPYSKPKAAWKSSADSGTENAMAPGANENSQQSFLYDSETDHCFFLTLSATARNILNRVNPGIPVGHLTSPLFGESNRLASRAGAEDEGGGNNRRIVFRVRLGF